MPIDALKVQAVHAELRAYFKGQPKSRNKGYHPLPPAAITKPDAKKSVGLKPAHWKIVPGPAQRAQRQRDAEFVNLHLDGLRTKLDCLDLVQSGFTVLDQPRLIGNCCEMSQAAGYLVLLRKAGTPWIVEIDDPADHMFCMVTDGRKPTSFTVNEFAMDFSGAWIIDPWANVCCEITDYSQEFIKQMESWKQQGKFVRGFFHKAVDPTSQEYLSGITSSALEYALVTGAIPHGLPRAVREHKDGKVTTAWSPPGKSPVAGYKF